MTLLVHQYRGAYDATRTSEQRVGTRAGLCCYSYVLATCQYQGGYDATRQRARGVLGHEKTERDYTAPTPTCMHHDRCDVKHD
eukprot:1569979-Rhodomonas_salina.3